MSTKSVYLLETLVKASFAFRCVIWAFFKGFILLPKFTLKVAIYIIKVLYSGSRATTANYFFLISSTCLVVRSMSLVV